MALPVPPKDLWEGYGRTPDEYVRSRQEDFQKMQAVLDAAGFRVPPEGRVLDFGCAAGRMLRWWPQDLQELWGVDISAPHITWCLQNLGPPFMFSLTTHPHLPFRDHYFDFLYAASVFTHIAVNVDKWILELRRVLKAGGLAYITIHDEHTMELLRAMPDHWVTRLVAAELGSLPSKFDHFVVGGTTPRYAVVFNGRDCLVKRWSAWLEVVSVVPEAYHYQTALLLRRPTARAGRQRETRARRRDDECG